MDMITDWTARRSGAGITISGKLRTDAGDINYTIAGIMLLEATATGIVATKADGDKLILAAFTHTAPDVPVLQ